MQSHLDGGRLHRLRTARATTQADLAAQLNTSVTLLNRIEGGHQQIDERTTAQLANALDCSTEMLSRPLPDQLYSRPWLRAYADAPKKTVDEYVADTLLAMECIGQLRLKRIPERLPLFDGDANSEDDIEEFALEVREEAGVDPDKGVPNVTRAVERLGCVVLPLDSELGKHLGMSMHVDGVPVLRASRPVPGGGVPGDRQRFTLAHELGHVTMHATLPPPDTAEQAKAIEKQAHRFAGAFLLPGDPFLSDLEAVGGRVTLTTLANLKGRWGVAIKAMVVRLQNLGRIEGDQARSLYKQISARGWNKNEPVTVGNERAVWMDQALAQRFRGEADAMSAAGLHCGLGRPYLESWVSWEPRSGLDADVLDLSAHRRARGSRG